MGIKAKNIYTAVQEISESEFLSQIESDISQKNSRFLHLKKDLKKLRKNVKNSLLQNSSENTNKNQFFSNETTRIANISNNFDSSLLKINRNSINSQKNAKNSSFFKKNDDSIFSLLAYEIKEKKSFFQDRARKASIFIEPTDEKIVKFVDFTKKSPCKVPKRWKLAKIDYISKNLEFEKKKFIFFSQKFPFFYLKKTGKKKLKKSLEILKKSEN